MEEKAKELHGDAIPGWLTIHQRGTGYYLTDGKLGAVVDGDGAEAVETALYALETAREQLKAN